MCELLFYKLLFPLELEERLLSPRNLYRNCFFFFFFCVYLFEGGGGGGGGREGGMHTCTVYNIACIRLTKKGGCMRFNDTYSQSN